MADTGGRGLLLRGEEVTPIRVADLAEGSAMQVAAAAMLRLGVVAQRAAELLRDHPDADVRRSAAVLAARAHPLVEGLGATDGD